MRAFESDTWGLSVFVCKGLADSQQYKLDVAGHSASWQGQCNVESMAKSIKQPWNFLLPTATVLCAESVLC
jgi:hypothetical protein